MTHGTWSNLIAVLKHVANSEEAQESDRALAIFSEILSLRTFDTSTVMALLAPVPNEEEGEGAGNAPVDLANMGSNPATNIFALKFLLCGAPDQQTTNMQN